MTEDMLTNIEALVGKAWGDPTSGEWSTDNYLVNRWKGPYRRGQSLRAPNGHYLAVVAGSVAEEVDTLCALANAVPVLCAALRLARGGWDGQHHLHHRID